MSGTTSPASRRRTIALSTRSRAEVEQRWRDDEIAVAAAKPRRPIFSTSSRAARRSTRWPPPTALKVETANDLKRGGPRGDDFGQDDRRDLPHRQGRLRQRRGRQPDAMDRVPRDRRQNAEPRSEFARRQDASTQTVQQPDVRRSCSANMSPGSKTISAPPSIRRRWRRPWATARRIPTECRSSLRRQSFAARYAAGEPQVVWTTLVADLETPVSAFLKIAGASGRPMSFLLESVEGGAVRGRYSIIGLEPDLIFRVNGEQRRDQPHGRRPIPRRSCRSTSRRSRRCAL